MKNQSDWVRNPYFERMSREVSFRLDFDSIAYFQQLGEPYGYTAEDMMYRYLRYMAGRGDVIDINEPTLAERKQLREAQDLELQPVGKSL